MSEPGPTSAFYARHREALLTTASLGPALDVACGRGRHARDLAAAGHPVIGVDRNAEFLRELQSDAPSLARVRFDLERGDDPPFAAGAFGAVLVFRYLHRPLASTLTALLAPGGLLVYETFTTALRALGWGPSRDAFLLEPGELPTLFPGLEVLEFEEGLSQDATPAAVASLLARRPDVSR